MSSHKTSDPTLNETFLPVTSRQKDETPTPDSKLSFLVDIADVHSMKRNLQDLLVSFRAGKLKAFSDKDAIDRMENIRNMQGSIACYHFDLDAKVNYKRLEDSDVDRVLHDNNMTSLLGNLEDLGSAIKSLNSHETEAKKA